VSWVIKAVLDVSNQYYDVIVNSFHILAVAELTQDDLHG